MARRLNPRVWQSGAALVVVVLLAAGVLWFRQKDAPPVEVDQSSLVSKDGRLYRAGEEAPFDGMMIEHYPDGSRKSRSKIVDGVLHGVSEGWYTNGVLQVREEFKEGISHGLRTKWHQNGKKMSETAIVEGKLHGTFRRWHENGVLAEQIQLAGGEPEGRSVAFYPSGFLKAEATLDGGKLVEQKFWDDGEMKPPDGDGKGM